MYINYDQDGLSRSQTSFIVALAIHAVVFASLLITSESKLLPEGTAPITIDFEALEVSKGQQTTSFKKAKKTIEAPLAEAPKSLPKTNISKDDVVIAKKPKAKKPKPKAKKKIAKKPKPKAKSKPKKIVAAITELPDAADQPELKEPALDDSVFDEKELAENDDLEQSLFEDESNLLEEEEEPQTKELPAKAPLVSKISKEPEVDRANRMFGRSKNNLPEKKPGSSNHLDSKSKNTVAQSPKEFGLPSGTVSYLKLKQRNGNVSPVYPYEARRSKVSGKTILVYYVNRFGLVKGIKVQKSSGHRILDNAAVNGVKRWRYYPGQPNWTVHPVIFKLDGKSTLSPSRLRLSQRAR